MRWVATYKGGSLFNHADGLFAIDKVRKIGFVRGNSQNWRYLGIVILPEDYVIYETNLEIEQRPTSIEALKAWNNKYGALLKKIMIDVIAELEEKGSESEIIDLMERFGFSET
jgi:hypothetical protein